MLKGSLSLRMLRWFDEVEVRDLPPQKLLFSVGEGWKTGLSAETSLSQLA